MRVLKLTWLGGEHEFALRLGELRALQDATDAGPEEIFNRLRLGGWKIDEVVQVIRWGLVGGGMDSAAAARLVTPLVDLHPLTLFKLTAIKVLQHALLGPEDDAPGEAGGVGTPAPESGVSRGSTATAQSSDSRRRKSTK